MSDEFILETARAWHIHPKKGVELADWVERKVNEDCRAPVFTKMLRQYMGTYHERKGDNYARVYSQSQRQEARHHPPCQPASQGSAHSQQTLFALPAKGHGSS